MCRNRETVFCGKALAMLTESIPGNKDIAADSNERRMSKVGLMGHCLEQNKQAAASQLSLVSSCKEKEVDDVSSECADFAELVI